MGNKVRGAVYRDVDFVLCSECAEPPEEGENVELLFDGSRLTCDSCGKSISKIKVNEAGEDYVKIMSKEARRLLGDWLSMWGSDLTGSDVVDIIKKGVS